MQEYGLNQSIYIRIDKKSTELVVKRNITYVAYYFRDQVP